MINDSHGGNAKQEGETEEEYMQRRKSRRGDGGGGGGGGGKAAAFKVEGLRLDGCGDDGSGEDAGATASTPRAAKKLQCDDGDTAQFDSMRELSEIMEPLDAAVGKKNLGVVVAGLERVVEICMKDVKLKIVDSTKAAFLVPIVRCMSWSKENLVLILSGCCALACLTKSTSRYPRTIWEAAAEAKDIPALISALKTLGPRFDQPAREALANVVKNDKKATEGAVKAGADWLPSFIKEQAEKEMALKQQPSGK